MVLLFNVANLLHCWHYTKMSRGLSCEHECNAEMPGKTKVLCCVVALAILMLRLRLSAFDGFPTCVPSPSPAFLSMQCWCYFCCLLCCSKSDLRSSCSSVFPSITTVVGNDHCHARPAPRIALNPCNKQQVFQSFLILDWPQDGISANSITTTWLGDQTVC